jgi:hypothetical protein
MNSCTLLIAAAAVCLVFICLLPGLAQAQGMAPTVGWAMTQQELENTYLAPDDDAWLSYSILRGGDTGGTVSVRVDVVEQTIGAGNGPGQYELLIPQNPLAFGPGEVLQVIKARFHTANHDVFGRQYITLRLNATGASIPAGQEARTIYVEYPPAPGVGFGGPPEEGYSGAEGQAAPVVVNITREGDIYADSYVDVFASGTASHGFDYTLADVSGKPVPVPGTIRLPPGQGNFSLYMGLASDHQGEGNETAVLSLGNLKNAVPGARQAITVTIREGGQATPGPAPSATPAAVATERPTQAPSTTAGPAAPTPAPSAGPGLTLVIVAIAGTAAGMLATRK